MTNLIGPDGLLSLFILVSFMVVFEPSRTLSMIFVWMTALILSNYPEIHKNEEVFNFIKIFPVLIIPFVFLLDFEKGRDILFSIIERIRQVQLIKSLTFLVILASLFMFPYLGGGKVVVVCSIMFLFLIFTRSVVFCFMNYVVCTNCLSFSIDMFFAAWAVSVICVLLGCVLDIQQGKDILDDIKRGHRIPKYPKKTISFSTCSLNESK